MTFDEDFKNHESLGYERIAPVIMGEQPVCLTKVDFTPFLPLKAKIDRIDFYCRESDLEPGAFEKFREQIKDGHLVRPKGRKWIRYPGAPWLSVNDPSLRDLHYLTDRFYEARVFRFEVAVDARLPPGANDLKPLYDLKAQLRHSMFPQEHSRLPLARRKYYDLLKERFHGDGLGTEQPKGQIIWEAPGQDDKMALYIKEKDRDNYVPQPWVRMESRLIGSGCSSAGLRCLGMLPNFADQLRTYVSDMFFVADGFKNAAEIAVGHGIPKDPWSKWGAQWTAKGRARLNPDNDANRLIGLALNNLRTSLIQLKPPKAVAGGYKKWIDDHTF